MRIPTFDNLRAGARDSLARFPFVLLAAVVAGLGLALALTSERVELDDHGIRVGHPRWCAWWLRRGWRRPAASNACGRRRRLSSVRCHEPSGPSGRRPHTMRATAPEALPGALDFVHYAMQNGVTVFYLSNRRFSAALDKCLKIP